MPTVKVAGAESVGRKLRTIYREASDPSWNETGREFHRNYRPRRFTEEFAREANYTSRKASYNRKKFKRFGHQLPLVWSGETRELSRLAKIKSRGGTGQVSRAEGGTSKESNRGGVDIKYPHARKLNFRTPHTQINMREEFTSVSNREAVQLGWYWEARFTPRFNSLGSRK